MSDEAILQSLGARVARERLGRDWSQVHLAGQAGVSRATIQRLEDGQSTQLTNLVRVLRALDLLRNLDALLPAAPVRPLQRWKHSGGSRQRASSKPAQEESGWQWGEDRGEDA